MGSTTQYDRSQMFHPEQARRYVEQKRWSDALKECDGLLNGSDRSYFTSAEIWGMRAISLLWLGKHDEAESSLVEVEALGAGTTDMVRWYLRQKLAYHGDRGEIKESDATLARLLKIAPMPLGVIAMRNGRVRYNAGIMAHTRGRRDACLSEAVAQFASAETIWNAVESVEDTTRLENYALWFLAIVNQSKTSWHMSHVNQLLENIELLDAPMATTLRKKLRRRKYLGFRVYR